MYWRIFCTDWQSDPDYQFQAELCEVDCSIIYAEDGARGEWATNGPTQEESARRLVDKVLHGEPEYAPMHGPDRNAMKKECPPELSGGPK